MNATERQAAPFTEETLMKFRETRAWTVIRSAYWLLVLATAGFYYWIAFIKDIQ